MDSSLFEVAVNGDTNRLKNAKQGENTYFLQTSNLGNNILHIAAQHKKSEFIKEALDRFPDLLQQKNKVGNTPIHEAAALGNKDTINVLRFYFCNSGPVNVLLSGVHDTYTSTGNTASDNALTITVTVTVPYLFERNNKGDTPFHTALRSQNLEAAEELFADVQDNLEILLCKNNFGETPLHVYVRYFPGGFFPQNLQHDEKPKLFIDRLIDANPLAIFENDSEGLNPLIRAAQGGRVFVVHRILSKHKLSVECRDEKGRCFLHHLRLRMNDNPTNARDKASTLWFCEKILQLPEIVNLKFLKDEDGNTPLHLAILDRDFDVAQLILQPYAFKYDEGKCEWVGAQSEWKELMMSTNNDGKTVFDLITSVRHNPADLRDYLGEVQQEKNLAANNNLFGALVALTTQGEYVAANSKLFGAPVALTTQMEQYNMGSILSQSMIKAAVGGKFPEEKDYGDDSFLSQAVDGSNIIHIALRHDQWKFICKAIERFPNLIYQKDSNGDTPLHIAARLRSETAEKLLIGSFKHWNYVCKKSLDNNVPPWKVKNSKNQTLLHEAAQTSNYYILRSLIILCKEYKAEVLSDVNDNGETILHIIARCGTEPDDPTSFFDKITDPIESILVCSVIAVYTRDMDGLVPILRAAHCGQIWLVNWIAERYPESKNIRDYKGRTALHHLCTFNTKSSEIFQGSYLCIIDQILSQDIDGNTPLHLAILDRNFDLAHNVLKLFYNERKSSHRRIKELMEIKNNDGRSIIECLDTVASDIPSILKSQIEQANQAKIMDDKLYKAVKEGSVNLLEKFTHDDLSSHTPDGSNIIHIALRNNRSTYIWTVLKQKFHLLYEKDSKGDTPLHLAARLPISSYSETTDFIKWCLQWRDKGLNPFLYAQPWTVRNSKGNTFIHEAAQACNYPLLSLFWKFDNETNDGEVNDLERKSTEVDIVDVNYHGETVLHLIAMYANSKAKSEFLDKIHGDVLKSIIYKRDNEGFTPVLRAVQSSRLGVANFLVGKFSQSVEIPDHKGRTVLHHLKALVEDHVDDLKDVSSIWNDLIRHPEVDALRIVQDDDGNTPLHLAIIEGDVTKVKFLMDKCLNSEHKSTELAIVNKGGQSVFDLVSSSDHTPATTKRLQQLVSRLYIREKSLTAEMMDPDLYKAAKDGEDDIFEKDVGEERFGHQTPDGSNIIHVALRHGNSNAVNFVTNALKKFPQLSMRLNNNGDTPLHLAAKLKDDAELMKLLVTTAKSVKDKEFNVVDPWAVKNYRGNYPIHEALQAGNLKVARVLLERDNEFASRVNALGETPLHAFAKTGLSLDSTHSSEVTEFVKKSLDSKELAYMRDDDGLTPLLSAAKSGSFQVVRAILDQCPQSAYLGDPQGRNFLHLLRFTGEDIEQSFDGNFKETGKKLFKIPEADAQRLAQDFDGNTPLHYAIKTGNSIAAIVFTKKCVDSKQQTELRLADKQGQTIHDLLANHDVPNEVLELIRKKNPKAVYLARSSYGIRKTEMKDSANALSIVAGLLATITFAAGLQVPGGFDSQGGFPILLKELAFKVYVLANSTAMGGSMVCLFLLLYVMGIGKTHGSLMLLDISIVLLRISFYLTLVTFTMGVFVVTVKKSLWLATLVCGLCFVIVTLTRTESIQFAANLWKDVKNSVESFRSKRSSSDDASSALLDNSGGHQRTAVTQHAEQATPVVHQEASSSCQQAYPSQAGCSSSLAKVTSSSSNPGIISLFIEDDEADQEGRMC